MNKWQFALRHAVPSVVGSSRTLIQNPGFGAKLFRARAEFFLRRRLAAPIATPDGFVIETPNELISYWSFFVERECWAPEWVETLRREVEPVVIDVGANAGLFSHLVWWLKPEVRLVVFEPLPEMAQKIRSWQVRTGARAFLHEAAVSNQQGVARFFVSSGNDTTASLRDSGDKETSISVPVTTLDSAVTVPKILLIKIDVEGCEPEVLAGARQTIKKTRFLLIEAHTDEALRAIRGHLGQEWKHRRVGASDHLFSRWS